MREVFGEWKWVEMLGGGGCGGRVVEWWFLEVVIRWCCWFRMFFAFFDEFEVIIVS